MQVSSDERVSTLFESGYADEERVVDPLLVFASDKKLAALVEEEVRGRARRREAQREGGQGMDREGAADEEGRARGERRERRVSAMIANTSFDPMVLAKISGARRRRAGMIDRLTAEEKEDLIDLARNLVKDEVTSVTAYGSKVAGYARPDSDYDLIISVAEVRGSGPVQVRRRPRQGLGAHSEGRPLPERREEGDAGGVRVGQAAQRPPAPPERGVRAGGGGREQEEGHRGGHSTRYPLSTASSRRTSPYPSTTSSSTSSTRGP